jgi:hypothetical protein
MTPNTTHRGTETPRNLLNLAQCLRAGVPRGAHLHPIAQACSMGTPGLRRGVECLGVS